MENNEYRRFGLILELQIQFEAMKLQNQIVGVENVNEQGYPPEEFFKLQQRMSDLCHAHIDQLF